jgi:large subunit ribosomal protein L3
MLPTIIGKKAGMTQIFNESGESVPVTIIAFEDAIVVSKKTEERDGYNAIQIGTFDIKKAKNVPKPIKGMFKNDKKGKERDLPFKSVLKEIRIDKSELEKFNIGDKVALEGLFKDGDMVDVSGVSKGKGFQGTIKRHNFAGGPASHGGMNHRIPGSIGSNTYPAHVWPGKRMAGHMGVDNKTIQNLRVEKFDLENKFMLVRGAVPGGKNGLLLIKRALKAKKKEIKKKS